MALVIIGKKGKQPKYSVVKNVLANHGVCAQDWNHMKIVKVM